MRQQRLLLPGEIQNKQSPIPTRTSTLARWIVITSQLTHAHHRLTREISTSHTITCLEPDDPMSAIFAFFHQFRSHGHGATASEHGSEIAPRERHVVIVVVDRGNSKRCGDGIRYWMIAKAIGLSFLCRMIRLKLSPSEGKLSLVLLCAGRDEHVDAIGRDMTPILNLRRYIEKCVHE